MLRGGEAPAVVLPSHLPAVSQPATVDTSCCASWGALGSGGDLVASGPCSLALLKSPHHKGIPIAGHCCHRNSSCAFKGREMLWQDGF